MADDQKNLMVQPGAEFQALPLEFIIAAPLVGAIKAQAVAAETTRAFIESLIDNKHPTTVDFQLKLDQDKAGKVTKQDVSIKVPLLSLVPIPHLRIDSITTHFKYEISQVVSSEQALDKGLSGEANLGVKIIPFLSATFKGNVTSSSKDSSTLNRSGSLEITVNASEAPMPEGLAKILNLLASTIPAPAAASNP